MLLIVDTSKDKVKKMKEEWKDIKGFEGAYMISNKGNVMSLPRHGTKVNVTILRKISMTHDGYAKVRLLYNGKDETHRVHRLVAEAFIPNPEGKETVNHIDGNKVNNNVCNLEWADRSEQLQHAYDNGLRKPVHTNRKFTEEQAEAIRKEYVRQSKEHGTVALAKKYGVNNSTIGMIVRGIHYA